MKKRLLSWLLVLVMVMSIAPMSALAAENNEPAWEQYVMSAVDYEHARFSFAAVFGKSVNITKTGIDLYNSTGKLTYSAKDDVNISSSRIKIDYTVPYKGKTLMTAELYVVADGEKYVYSSEFNMIHIHDTGDKIIEPTCTEKGIRCMDAPVTLPHIKIPTLLPSAMSLLMANAHAAALMYSMRLRM